MERGSRRGWIGWAAALVVTVVSFTWSVRGVSLARVWSALGRADPIYLGVAVAALLASFALRARRWGTLLGGSGLEVSFALRHAGIYVGFAGNCLLPGHAGELGRSLLLQRVGGARLSVVLGSILTERLLDGLTALLLLILALVVAARHDQHSAHLGLKLPVLAIALVGTSLALIGAARHDQRLARMIGRLVRSGAGPKLAERAESVVGGLLRGLGPLRNPACAGLVLLESLAIWLVSGVTYWAALVAFDLGSVGPLGALLVQSVAAFGIALPSSPGYFGPYEAAVRLALDGYGIAPATSLAYALTVHALVFLTVTTIGLLCAIRLKLALAPTRPTGSAKS